MTTNELELKERRVAYWETHGALPVREELEDGWQDPNVEYLDFTG